MPLFKRKLCPFSIVIDSAEQYAFGFNTILESGSEERGDAVYFDVKTTRKSLGRHPNSFGDYSVYGAEGLVAIERKSQGDAYSTILGYGDGHRDRFEAELANLSGIVAAVVVEVPFGRFMAESPDTGQKSAEENMRNLWRSYLAMTQDYGVPWYFAENKSHAEVFTFRFLERFWLKTRKAGASGNHIRGTGTGSERSKHGRKRWEGTQNSTIGNIPRGCYGASFPGSCGVDTRISGTNHEADPGGPEDGYPF